MVWLGADINEIGGVIGGVAAAIAILIALYAGSMALYFKLKKVWASRKWFTEFIFIGAVIIISFVIKIFVYYTLIVANNNTVYEGQWYDGMNATWQALYAAIGGLTFEGLADSGALITLLQSFYYGSSVYAGLMILSVFTMKWSYEIYSFIRLKGFEKNKDIYVFTALTEETLQLAKSIKEEYSVDKNRREYIDAKKACKKKYKENKKEHKKNKNLLKTAKQNYKKTKKENKKKYKEDKIRKYRIVFSGPKLDAFDRNDDLCRQLVSYDFLYWSYYKQTDSKKHKNKSLAQILHLNNKNIRTLELEAINKELEKYKKDKAEKEKVLKNTGTRTDKKLIREIRKDNRSIKKLEKEIFKYRRKQEARFCIFAFESKDHIPEEEDNMGFVFEDIKNRICKSEKDSLRIEYYILTKRDIDYQAYDYKNRELMLDFASSFEGVKIKRKFKKKARYTYPEEEYESMKIIAKTIGFRQAFLKDGNCKFNGYKHFEKIAKELYKDFSRHVIVRAINEALIISKDAIKDIVLPFEVAQSDSDREKLNVYVLGFGSTGQAIAKAIHMRCAYINSKGYATDIHFDVFDSNAGNIGGLYAKEHPMWICNSEEEVKKLILEMEKETDKTIKEKDTDTQNRYDKVKDLNKGIINHAEFIDWLYKNKQDERREEKYSKYYNKFEDAKEKTEARRSVEKEIIFPTVYFYAKSCFDISILDKIDNVTGAQGDGKPIPSIIVVALGSDYDNIKMTNALILDIIREGISKDKDKYKVQTIIVNIWDSHNNDLIDSAGGVWENNHKTLKLDIGLTVKIVGNNDDIYTYKKMAYHKPYAQYNARYEDTTKLIGSLKYDKDKGIDEGKDIVDQMLEGEGENYIEFIEKAKSQIKQECTGALANYEKLDMWKKESTDLVREIREIYKTLYDLISSGKKYHEILANLSRMEHQRWLRFHIANGWIYSTTRNDLCKMHNKIVPFNYLATDSLYNLLNVIQALEDCEKENISTAEEKSTKEKQQDVVATNIEEVTTDNAEQSQAN